MNTLTLSVVILNDDKERVCLINNTTIDHLEESIRKALYKFLSDDHFDIINWDEVLKAHQDNTDGLVPLKVRECSGSYRERGYEDTYYLYLIDDVSIING